MNRYTLDDLLHSEMCTIAIDAALRAGICAGDGDDQFTATAFHEAAHAVVAEVVGIEPVLAEIHREPVGNARGGIKVAPSTRDDSNYFMGHCATACAGALGVFTYAGPSFVPVRGSYLDDARRMVHWSERHSRRTSPEPFQIEAADRAATIIKERYAAVVELARDLLRFESIDREGIIAAMLRGDAGDTSPR